MARLDIDADPFIPGRWTLRSDAPAVLAGACDALVQGIGLEAEVLVAWGLHPDEQDGMRDHAYEDERAELGPLPIVQVLELPRPRQQHVVWVDRYHLLAAAAPPQVGSRLLGLYVGSKGRIVLAIHHPSVSAIVQGSFQAMPDSNGRDWDVPALVDQCRVVLRYDASAPNQLDVRAPQPMAHAVQDAFTRLAAIVAGW